VTGTAANDESTLAERADQLRARVADVGFWWHSIDLGDGVVTPGAKSAAWLDAELARLNLGDLRGKSVLDIGAYDGYYSFAAERMGAERVVALDHWVWSVDLPAWMDYREKRIAAGLSVEPAETLPDMWRPGELPGRRAFDLAHAALGSSVEVVVGDLLDYDLSKLGTFDVVLYLGVLYHVRHPLLALERLAAVTRGTAIIETQAELFRGSGHRPLCRFIEGDELNHDPSNFWTFNEAALVSMCRAAGFETADLQDEPGRMKRRVETILRGSALYRAVVHTHR
jgi:tRNA (mo5U34)-methyltransferase